MKRRILGVLLVLCMLFSMLPVTVTAAVYEEKPDSPATYLLTVINGTVGDTGLSAVYAEPGTAVTVTAGEMPDEATFAGWSADKGTLPEGTDTTAASVSFEMPACDLTLTAVYAIDIGAIAEKTEIEGVYKTYPSTSQDITTLYLLSGKYILTGEESDRRIFCYNSAEIVGMEDDGDSLIISSLNNEEGGVISGGWVSADNNFSNEEGAVITGVKTESPVSNKGTITGGEFNGEVWNHGGITGGTFNDYLSNDEGGVISGGTFTDPDSNIYGFGTITGGTFYLKVEADGGISGGTFYGRVKACSEISGGLFLGDVSIFTLIDQQSRTYHGSITGGIFRDKPSGYKGALSKLTVINGFIAGIADMSEAYAVPGTAVSAEASMPEGVTFSAWSDRTGTLPAGTQTGSSTVSFAMPASDVILKASPADQGTVLFAAQPDGKNYPKLTLESGVISGTELTQAYVIPGADVTVKAVLDEGEDFSAWTVTSGTAPADIDLKAEETVFTMTADDLALSAAADNVDSGTCGTGLKWSLNDNGVLTISGTGAMTDYSNEYGSRAPWSEYEDDIYSVVIKPGVTTVGDYAFYYLSEVTDVSLPDSLTSIGEEAFYGCGFTTIDIPENVASIGKKAFSNCMYLTAFTADTDNPYFSVYDGALYNKAGTMLIVCPGGKTAVTWPTTVTSIGDYAFTACYNLESLTVPGTVTSIGDYAFYMCCYLKEITLPAGLTSIGEGVFEYCYDLESAAIPAGVTTIGNDAFYSCYRLAGVTLPAGLTSIGDYAFEYCGKLDVTLPAGLKSIGEEAFYGCESLSAVTIPASVEEIGPYAFNYCEGLEAIAADADNPYFSAFDGALYNKTQTEMLTYPGGKTTDITWPATVTSIGEGAFSDCYNITSLTLPATVTSIGDYAFYYCCYMEEITLPAGLTSIGDHAFYYCESLKEIVIPDSVVSIGEDAFEYCYELESAYVPAGAVFADGGYGLSGCSELSTVYFGGTQEQWDDLYLYCYYEYPLLTVENGTINGTAFARAYIREGTEVTVAASVAAGEKFCGWMSAGTAPADFDPTGISNTFEMTEDALALTADIQEEAQPKPAQTVTASDVTATYGDTDAAIAASAEGALSYAVKAGSEGVVTVDADGSLTLLRTGTATVTVTAAETETYGAGAKEVTVTVNPKVTLRQGGEVKYTAESADLNGILSFGEQQIAAGAYDLVAELGDRTSTSLVKFGTGEAAVTSFEIPAKPVKAELKKGERATEIVVGGLDDVAAANSAENTETAVTMTVTELYEDEVETGILAALKEAASVSKMKFFDMSIIKTAGGTQEPVTDTGSNLLTVIVPISTAGIKNLKVVRYHGTAAEALTEWDGTGSPSEGTYAVDRTANRLAIFAGKFSIYGIGYDPDKTDRKLAFTADTVKKEVGAQAFTNELTGSYDDVTVTYESSDETVATVSANGQVTISGAGTATITARAEETDTYMAGKAEFTLTVEKKDREISFTVSAETKTPGDSGYKLFLTGSVEGTLTYESSDEAVATVSEDGTVTIRGTGTATITAYLQETATYKAGKAEYKLTVEKLEPELFFPFSPETCELQFSGYIPYLASIPSGATVTYESSNETVATVSANGTVTLKAPGQTTITARTAETDTYKEGKAEYKLTVVKNTRIVTFTDGWSPEIALNDAGYFNAPTDEIDAAVSYRSSDPLIASVDPVTGKVTPHAPGNVKIIMTYAETETCSTGSEWYGLTVLNPESGKYCVTLYNGTVNGVSQYSFEAGAEVSLETVMPQGETFTEWIVLDGSMPDGTDLSKQQLVFDMPENNIILAAGPVTVDLGEVSLTSMIPGAATEARGRWIDLNLNKGKFILTGDLNDNSETVFVYNNAEIVGCDAENMIVLQNSDGSNPTDPNWGEPGPGIISGGFFEAEEPIMNFGTITGGTFSADVNNCQFGVITGGTFTGDVSNDNGNIAGGLFLGFVNAWSGITGGIFQYQPMCFGVDFIPLTVTNGYICGHEELTAAYVVPGTEVTVTASLPSGVTFECWTAEEGAVPEGTDTGKQTMTFIMPDEALTLNAVRAAAPACTGTREVGLSAGSHELRFGDVSFGVFTFTESAQGWSIRDAEGRYLAGSDGMLVLQAEPFWWTVSGGDFRYDVTEQSGGMWPWYGGWGWNWGWNWNWGTTTQTTTWYLTADGTDLTVSKTAPGRKAAFYDAFSYDDHDLRYEPFGNGQHKAVCKNCGKISYEDCRYGTDHKCTVCGVIDPDLVYVTATFVTGKGASAAPAPVTVISGEGRAERPADPVRTGYLFGGWFAEGADDAFDFSGMLTADVTITAKWTKCEDHEYANGRCVKCGEAEPEPEPVCVYEKNAYLAEGKRILTLGGNRAGEFTFARSGGGWTIRAEDGRYLSFSNNAFTYAAAPFVWTWSNGSFTTTVTTYAPVWGGWNWWGGTGTTVTTYYLVCSGGRLSVSASPNGSSAGFAETVRSAAHTFGGWKAAADGQHVRTCVNCGLAEYEDCRYGTDHKCAACGRYDPAYAKIDVTVKVEQKTSYGSFWYWWSYPTVSWQVTITAEAAGTGVRTVEYSQDGRFWTRGTSFTGNTAVTKLFVRVTDSSGTVSYWTYENGFTVRSGS